MKTNLRRDDRSDADSRRKGMNEPFWNLTSIMLIVGVAAFCWRTYRTTDDSAVRAVSYTLAVLAVSATFYMAFIRFLFTPCAWWW